MPAKRVVTGQDDRGRPKAQFVPEAVETPAYGFMEPAMSPTIERRKATPEELAAARAREDVPSHLTRPTNGTPPTVVRQLDAPFTGDHAVMVVDVRGDDGSPDHLPTEALVNDPVFSPPVPDEVTESDLASSDLARLAEAADTARQAFDAQAAAAVAWEIAREDLARAYAAVEFLIEPLPPQPDDGYVPLEPPSPNQSYVPPGSVSDVVARQETQAIRRGPRKPGRHASSATERQEIALRRERVMEAVGRLGENWAAIGAELDMRPNAVAMVAKHARRQPASA